MSNSKTDIPDIPIKPITGRFESPSIFCEPQNIRTVGGQHAAITSILTVAKDRIDYVSTSQIETTVIQVLDRNSPEQVEAHSREFAKRLKTLITKITPGY